MIFQEFKENHGAFKFLVVSFQSSDFLDTKSRIQLSVTIAKFYPFVCHSVPYSHYELQFRFVMKLKFEQPKKFRGNEQHYTKSIMESQGICF